MARKSKKVVTTSNPAFEKMDEQQLQSQLRWVEFELEKIPRSEKTRNPFAVGYARYVLLTTYQRQLKTYIEVPF